MTIIVGVLEPATLVADSFHGNGDLYIRTPDKVFARTVPGIAGFGPGRMLIGISGSLRFAQLVRYHFELPENGGRAGPQEYLVKDFVDPLREMTRAAGLEAKDDDEHKASGVMVICYRSKLFVIHTDWQIEETTDEGFAAVGAGRELAFGAMGALGALCTPSDLTADHARLAVEAAIRFSPWCAGPVVSISDNSPQEIVS